MVNLGHERAEALTTVAPVPTLVAAGPAVHPSGRRLVWLGRLSLVLADVFAILVAFFGAERLLDGNVVGLSGAGALLLATVPLWIAALNGAGLYDRDEAVVGHSTIDELPRLAQVASVGTWLLL